MERVNKIPPGEYHAKFRSINELEITEGKYKGKVFNVNNNEVTNNGEIEKEDN